MEMKNIALPESMKQYVQERVSAGGISWLAGFVIELPVLTPYIGLHLKCDVASLRISRSRFHRKNRK
jgi:hypothetical protein